MPEEPILFTLPNGIRVVHQYMAREVVHLGLLIGFGSRDERAREHGLAHFYEHCLFKGTEHRKTFHILSRLDAVGGELNAFTAKEETWIHATFLRQHLDRAVELIADIAFHASFPEKELEKEKTVIADEIHSYLDSPSDMIFEEFDTLFFGEHPLGRSILGTEKSLSAFTREDLVRFRNRILHPDHLIISCAGPISPEQLRNELEMHFGSQPVRRHPRKRAAYTAEGVKSRTVQKDIHQVHYVMGFPAYSYPESGRAALTLISNVLGGPGLNNRLSLNIREKHGYAYHIDSSYAPFSDTGIFSVYLGTDRKHLERCRKLIWNELDAFRHKSISEKALRESKQQLLGQIAIGQDSGSAIMFNLGKSLLVFDKIDTLEDIYERVRQISAREVRDVASAIFDERKMTELVYEPAE